MQVSIVIPVYRSAPILPALAEQLHLELSKSFESFEVVLVNDCSPDDSWRVIVELSRKYAFIRGLNLRANVGQDNAIMAGLNMVHGDAIVIMDDDLQHPPAGIAPLVAELAKGYDVCYANFTTRQHRLWKRLGSAFAGWVASHIAGKPIDIYMSPFKALRRGLVRELIAYDGPYSYVDGLILSCTSRLTQIPMQHHSRLEGKSNYSLRKSIGVWLRLVTGFSILPLRLITYLGVAVAFLSFLLSAWFIAEYLTTSRRVEGWMSLLLMINFFGGVQLIAIGVLGEYVGRAYLRLNKKPQFSIAETCGDLSLPARPRKVDSSN
jgi:polyisoprenyl-phosphate glycosyltransferase